MIFGEKSEYKFAVYSKKKLHCLGKAYAFDQPPVTITSCPVKISDRMAVVFFPGPVFNTYVQSVEDSVTILKSYDDRLTFSKDRLDEGVLHTVKTISEDNKTREVVLYRFDDFFPGFTSRGAVEMRSGCPVFVSRYGAGPVVFQTNAPNREIEAMLASLDSTGPQFVEVNNPVERATVTVVKDLNNYKIVENGNISGILLGCKEKRVRDQVNVYVKGVYPGSYCFVEDVQPGPAEVQLIGREGSTYKVKYKSFIGTCADRTVKKTMKGVIYDVQGPTFKFKQDGRPDGFEEVAVPKRVRVTDEAQIRNDQMAAIEYIRGRIEDGESVDALFNKYMHSLKENDSLCLFYVKYLVDQKRVSESEIKKILRCASGGFAATATQILDDPQALRLIFDRKKTRAGFIKLLGTEKNKELLIKSNPEFLVDSIKYIYENMESPRVVVERVIGKAFPSWMAYAQAEEGSQKRSILRRMVQMPFKSSEMKQVFKAWAEFEELVGGDVEEVHRQASEYVKSKKV